MWEQDLHSGYEAERNIKTVAQISSATIPKYRLLRLNFCTWRHFFIIYMHLIKVLLIGCIVYISITVTYMTLVVR